MKIAYLILAHGNFEHCERLVAALDEEDVAFFVHIDKKATVPSGFLRNRRVTFTERLPVYWSGWSGVQATLGLMTEAIKSQSQYYVLISGVDYPIRPNCFLYSKLSEGGEFINIVKGYQPHKSRARIQKYYFDSFDRRDKKSFKRHMYFLLEAALSVLVASKVIRKPAVPFRDVFFGSTWWALTHSTVIYILNFLKQHPDYTKLYKNCWAPDESIFQTILGNSPIICQCRTNLTFTDWSTNPAPAIISARHLEVFKKQSKFESSYGRYEPFFARKFDDESSGLIERIDKELRE